jgi:phosphodiesterase/alkaline phosphatase D-like protein
VARRAAIIDTSSPRGFRLALTGTPTQMLASWTTPTAGAGVQRLRYGINATFLTSSCVPTLVPLPTDAGTATARCLMTGLPPSTRIYYQVQVQVQVENQEPGRASVVPPWPLSFVSAPPSGVAAAANYPVRVIAFGDVDWTDGVVGEWGSDPADVGDSRSVSRAACHDFQSGFAKAPGHAGSRPPFNATLTLHVGDISYSGPNSEGNTTLGNVLWDVFLREMECLSSAMPYMVGRYSFASL